jgi:hypothetical protein
MVGPARFELATSPLSGVRSNQLSYEPEVSKRPLRNKYITRSENSAQPLGD